MNRLFSVIAKVALIVILSLGSAFAVINGYYFLFALMVCLILALSALMVLSERRIIRRVKFMMESIQHGGLNVSFPDDLPGLNGNLNRAMNRALSAFRMRVYNYVVSEAEMEAWQKLIRVLAHEMMNSLAPIISLSETMTDRSENFKPDEREYALMLEAMKSIHRRSTGLLHFVENYRKLTHTPEPICQFFSLGELFADIGRLYGCDAGEIEFRVEPQSLRLYADRSQIEQVVLNLLKNAQESSEDNGNLHVRVKAEKEGALTKIQVCDNGPGIAPEGLDKIFVPFYTTKQTGSGIGLSLSRQIMNRHNGTITVESPTDGGAVFTLVFNQRAN